MNNHLVLAVKTLGTKTDAVVLAIGGAIFDPDDGSTIFRFCYLPPIDGQKGTVSAEIIKQWVKTNPILLDKYLDGSLEVGARYSWNAISTNFSALIYNYKLKGIWTDGNELDTLVSAFGRVGTTNPFEVVLPEEKMPIHQWRLAATLAGWTLPDLPEDYLCNGALSEAIRRSHEICDIWAFFANKGGIKND